jgi:hypothetical protein
VDYLLCRFENQNTCACVEMHRWTIYVRATLDKDPGIKMPQTNLKQIEPWIEPFLHILKKKFLKGLRSNSRVQYKKCVIDMWEDSVNFWFFLFTFFFMIFKNFLFSLSFCAQKGWKCTLSNSHLARIHKTSHVNSKMIQKMKELLCFQGCPQSIDVSSIFIKFENKCKRKQFEKTKKI